MAAEHKRSPLPSVAREDAASLIAWCMLCKLDVIPSGRSRLGRLHVGHSAVTDDLAWTDDPADTVTRRRSYYLRRSHAEAVDTLYRIAPEKAGLPHRWIKAELLSRAPITVLDHLQELSFRPPLVSWPFTWWDELNSTDPDTRESVLIRMSLLADELERAAAVEEWDYNRELLDHDAERIEHLVDLLLTIASGPPISARPAVRLLGRLCCHSTVAWEKIQNHVRSHPLGHRGYLAFTRMLRQPRTPRERAAEMCTWLVGSPEAQGRALIGHRCWNVYGQSYEALALLPTTERVREESDTSVGRPQAGPSEDELPAVSDVDYAATMLPSGLWPPERLAEEEALLRRRTAVVVALLREQARNCTARGRGNPDFPPDLVGEPLRRNSLNGQLSWRVRALAADGLRRRRRSSVRIFESVTYPDHRGATQRAPGGVPRRLDRSYRGDVSEILSCFDSDIKAGLDPSGGLAHAMALFQALERYELTRPGRPPALPMDESGHVLEDAQLRASPAISQVLDGILDGVIPDSAVGSRKSAEKHHRLIFTEAVQQLVDGLDPWFDLSGELAIPRAARRGVRVLIGNMLGSLDVGRERRAVSTLLAAGMAIPTMCVLNRILREDVGGRIANNHASFLTQLSLMYLGHLGENPLAGVVILRWLDLRWLEWREELRRTQLLEPESSRPDAQTAPWPTGDRLVEYLALRHKLELLHTAIWALGDIKWDAFASNDARQWLREKWKRGILLLHDVATYGLAQFEDGDLEEHAEGGITSALFVLRQAAYYALAVTRWDEVRPDDQVAVARRVPVAGAVRGLYSHEDGRRVAHAWVVPDEAQTPAAIARHATEAMDRVTINGERPAVLDGLKAWRADYRRLVYH
jgi:hypothetical protein